MADFLPPLSSRGGLPRFRLRIQLTVPHALRGTPRFRQIYSLHRALWGVEAVGSMSLCACP
jgi:hypothetical protein